LNFEILLRLSFYLSTWLPK